MNLFLLCSQTGSCFLLKDAHYKVRFLIYVIYMVDNIHLRWLEVADIFNVKTNKRRTVNVMSDLII